MNILLLILTAGLLVTASAAPIPSPAAPSSLRFSPGANGEFTFDTGILRGKLRARGKSNGLSEVLHIPTGKRLDASLGLFSHYRVFSANKRYGTAAWDWPSQATLRSDGSVQVRWPATADRPFELGAIYRWVTADTLDLETSAQAKSHLPKFESFLAAYFTADFTNALVYVKEPPGANGPGFLAAEKDAAYWHAFPRDDASAAIIKDGRWKYEPNPVDWTLRPQLALPLGIRRAPASDLTAVLMGRPQDCFALFMPYQTEPHYSMYLSLFGTDLAPGQTVSTHTRLVVRSHLSNEQALELDRQWLK